MRPTPKNGAQFRFAQSCLGHESPFHDGRIDGFDDQLLVRPLRTVAVVFQCIEPHASGRLSCPPFAKHRTEE